jgi:salicylate hydroxylase
MINAVPDATFCTARIDRLQVPKQSLKVGLIGAGIGGLAAAIAIARAGCDVTVLEAATELGEIGAGIQMTPNVSRLLIRWGVADIIGDNLVQCKYINMRRPDGTVFQRTEVSLGSASA